MKVLNVFFTKNSNIQIGVKYLADAQLPITNFNLGNCRKITNESLFSIANGLTNLESLTLIQNKITDEGLILRLIINEQLFN